MALYTGADLSVGPSGRMSHIINEQDNPLGGRMGLCPYSLL